MIEAAASGGGQVMLHMTTKLFKFVTPGLYASFPSSLRNRKIERVRRPWHRGNVAVRPKAKGYVVLGCAKYGEESVDALE